MRRDAAGERHRPAHHRPRRPQAFLEHVGQRPDVFQHFTIGPFPAVPRQPEHRLAGGIECADDAVAIDHEQSGGEAGDDLAAQALGGFRARFHRAFAFAELSHRVFHGRRHELRLRAGFPLVSSGGAGGSEDAKDGVGEDGGEPGDDRRQDKEEVAALGHFSRQSSVVGRSHSPQSESSVGSPSRAVGVGSPSRQSSRSSRDSPIVDRLSTDCRLLTVDTTVDPRLPTEDSD